MNTHKVPAMECCESLLHASITSFSSTPLRFSLLPFLSVKCTWITRVIEICLTIASSLSLSLQRFPPYKERYEHLLAM